MLEIENLSAGYGNQRVLHGVSLSLGDGQLVSVLGPNGHGKTTLLRCISGIVHPAIGHIRLDREEIGGLRIDQIVHRGVVHIPQGDLIFPQMSVLENLLMGAYLQTNRATTKQRLDQVYGLLPRLHERQHQIANTLSGGERRMLAIGRGLMIRRQDAVDRRAVARPGAAGDRPDLPCAHQSQGRGPLHPAGRGECEPCRRRRRRRVGASTPS
jgi:branched-chain amino acid transport system ATP-binding protein